MMDDNLVSEFGRPFFCETFCLPTGMRSQGLTNVAASSAPPTVDSSRLPHTRR